jgi:hypothetical protein
MKPSEEESKVKVKDTRVRPSVGSRRARCEAIQGEKKKTEE